MQIPKPIRNPERTSLLPSTSPPLIHWATMKPKVSLLLFTISVLLTYYDLGSDIAYLAVTDASHKTEVVRQPAELPTVFSPVDHPNWPGRNVVELLCQTSFMAVAPAQGEELCSYARSYNGAWVLAVAHNALWPFVLFFLFKKYDTPFFLSLSPFTLPILLLWVPRGVTRSIAQQRQAGPLFTKLLVVITEDIPWLAHLVTAANLSPASKSRIDVNSTLVTFSLISSGLSIAKLVVFLGLAVWERIRHWVDHGFTGVWVPVSDKRKKNLFRIALAVASLAVVAAFVTGAACASSLGWLVYSGDRELPRVQMGLRNFEYSFGTETVTMGVEHAPTLRGKTYKDTGEAVLALIVCGLIAALVQLGFMALIVVTLSTPLHPIMVVIQRSCLHAYALIGGALRWSAFFSATCFAIATIAFPASLDSERGMDIAEEGGGTLRISKQVPYGPAYIGFVFGTLLMVGGSGISAYVSWAAIQNHHHSPSSPSSSPSSSLPSEEEDSQTEIEITGRTGLSSSSCSSSCSSSGHHVDDATDEQQQHHQRMASRVAVREMSDPRTVYVFAGCLLAIAAFSIITLLLGSIPIASYRWLVADENFENGRPGVEAGLDRVRVSLGPFTTELDLDMAPIPTQQRRAYVTSGKAVLSLLSFFIIFHMVYIISLGLVTGALFASSSPTASFLVDWVWIVRPTCHVSGIFAGICLWLSIILFPALIDDHRSMLYYEGPQLKDLGSELEYGSAYISVVFAGLFQTAGLVASGTLIAFSFTTTARSGGHQWHVSECEKGRRVVGSGDGSGGGSDDASLDDDGDGHSSHLSDSSSHPTYIPKPSSPTTSPTSSPTTSSSTSSSTETI